MVRLLVAVPLLVGILASTAKAKISQNRLYSDHMVLESREAYDIRPFVTGFGDTPGEAVTVYFDTADDAETGTGTHASYPTTVGADGKWAVQMNCVTSSPV